jgi:hypothetical protein
MLIAEASASPVHFAVMFLATIGSRVPQMAFRSAGLGWTPIAARRHAGGVASATREKARKAKTKIEEAYMIESKRNRCWGIDGLLNGGKRT